MVEVTDHEIAEPLLQQQVQEADRIASAREGHEVAGALGKVGREVGEHRGYLTTTAPKRTKEFS